MTVELLDGKTGIDENFRSLLAMMGTHLSRGGLPRINTDPTKFDVTPGFGFVVDNSVVEFPVVRRVSWGQFTGLDVDNFDGEITFLAVNLQEQIVQSSTPFKGDDLRDYIPLGALNHPNHSTINNISEFTSARATDLLPALTELINALGPININGGNIFSGVSGTMEIPKTAGNIFFFGIQRDWKNNVIIASDELISPTFVETWRDPAVADIGFASGLNTVIRGGVYDDGTPSGGAPNGTLTTNSWTNHRIQFSPDANEGAGLVVVTYGQTTYNTSDDALAALRTEGFIPNPQAELVAFRAALTVRGGATDLSLATDAIFTPAGKIGEF